MTVYSYDPVTREYVGMTSAQPSPLEPGVFLIPANATPIEPPKPNLGEVVLFLNDEWQIIPDYRGQTWFDPASGDPVVIGQIGKPTGLISELTPELIVKKEAEAAQVMAEIAVKKVEAAWILLRSKRDAVLALTDRTQLLDFDEEARPNFATYRKTLRNLPENTVDPENPTWPALPADCPSSLAKQIEAAQTS